MVITIGWNNNTHEYLVELYVNGADKVHVYTKAPMQIIYLIRLMMQLYPISIAWHFSMPDDIKAALLVEIKRNLAV